MWITCDKLLEDSLANLRWRSILRFNSISCVNELEWRRRLVTAIASFGQRAPPDSSCSSEPHLGPFDMIRPEASSSRWFLSTMTSLLVASWTTRAGCRQHLLCPSLGPICFETPTNLWSSCIALYNLARPPRAIFDGNTSPSSLAWFSLGQLAGAASNRIWRQQAKGLEDFCEWNKSISWRESSLVRERQPEKRWLIVGGAFACRTGWSRWSLAGRGQKK